MQAQDIADLAPRLSMCGVLALAAGMTIGFPGCFAAVCPYFAQLTLASPYDDRLHDALCARKDAENIPMWLGRMLGLVTLVLAASVLQPAVPIAVPYAAWCVAFAATTAFACARFRQAASVRVAVLAPRDLRVALPAPVILAIAACGALELLMAVFSPAHLAWAAVALSNVALLWIAWRVADAPALILGADVPVERYVDERLRAARTMKVAGLAVAPAIVLLGVTHDFSRLGVAGWIVSSAAAAIAVYYMLRASRSIDDRSALAAMNAAG